MTKQWAYYSFIQCSEQATIKLVYCLRNGMEKLARLKNHLAFLICCRNNDIILYSLRVYLLLKSSGSKRIAMCTAGQAIVWQLISDTRCKTMQMERLINTRQAQLLAHVNGPLTDKQQRHLHDWCTAAESRMFQKTKSRQKMEEKHGESCKKISVVEQHPIAYLLQKSLQSLKPPPEDLIPNQLISSKLEGARFSVKQNHPPATPTERWIWLSEAWNKIKVLLSYQQTRAMWQWSYLNQVEYNKKLDRLLEDQTTYKKLSRTPTSIV